ncbi:MAG TPA: hypothetical protein VFF49_01695 [Thermodesulfobacteriota bacterium]|nr:hypothetical protein [Thermodesulfobacteriota bacterium]
MERSFTLLDVFRLKAVLVKQPTIIWHILISVGNEATQLPVLERHDLVSCDMWMAQ